MNAEVVNVSKPMFLVRGKEFRFIRFEAPDQIIAWKQVVKLGEHLEFPGILKIENIDTDNLKIIGVWEKLAKEIQDGLLKAEGEVPENLKRAWEARKSKGPKYPGVPAEITCIECHKVQKMSPGAIVKSAAKWALKNQLIPDTDKWLKQWRCQECHKTPRGRKANPNLPPKVTLTCKCGTKVIYPGSVALKFATKKGLTLDKYVEKFACQICKPSPRGRPKGKRNKK